MSPLAAQLRAPLLGSVSAVVTSAGVSVSELLIRGQHQRIVCLTAVKVSYVLKC